MHLTLFRLRPTFAVLSLALTAGVAFASPVNTDPAGGNLPYSNMQPSLAIHFAYQTTGHFGTGVPLRMFAYHDDRMAILQNAGWTLPEGQVLSIADNNDLFMQIGTTFGGDGIDTFVLPDMRGSAAIGYGQTPGFSNYVLGQSSGQLNTTLTIGQLPFHLHAETDSVSGFTDLTGSNFPVPNFQPSLAIRQDIVYSGQYPSSSGQPAFATPTLPFTSQILLNTAAPSAPYQFSRMANGTTLPINQYSALFSLLGTTFGGNGTTTFLLPDLRSRLTVGAGQGPVLTARSWGQAFGAESTALTNNNLPLHQHTVHNMATTGFAGSSFPFNISQPSLTLNYCIAMQGSYPGSTNGMDDQTGYLGEIILIAGNNPPVGYSLCQGQIVPISQNAALFSLLFTTFGGNGTTTFALPDLRGRVPIGASLTPGGFPAGTIIGQEITTLLTPQMPSHIHTFTPFCPADIGGAGGLPGHDGHLDNNDFIAFINDFFANNSVADVGMQGGLAGHDGLFDNNDFIAFINAFFAPCP